jgi:crossover junction endodeoxyribonuclease RuvC
MGYAVVEQVGNTLRLRTIGTLETASDLSLPERLRRLYEGVLQLIDAFQPTELAVEELFFNRNVRSALSVGQARGVALLAAAHRGRPVESYTPLQVKESVTGFGRAKKDQIQEMVRILLGLSTIPRPDDAADAAAIAICHLTSANARDTYARLAAPPVSAPRRDTA